MPLIASACIRPGLEERAALGVLGDRAVEQVEARLGQHQHGDDHAAGHQQAGLDDLHPRGGEHPAEDHVDDHERAGEDHRPGEVDPRQRLDDHAGADHLRQQVEERDRQRAERGGHPRGPLLHAEGQHVGHRELAGVAHPLGEQEHHRHEGHQRGDEADEAVEAEEEDQAGEAEERRRRHVVAGDREAVLAARDAAAGGPELGGGAGALRRPVGDAEGDGEDDREDRQSELVHDTCSRSGGRARSARGLTQARGDPLLHRRPLAVALAQVRERDDPGEHDQARPPRPSRAPRRTGRAPGRRGRRRPRRGRAVPLPTAS